MTQLRDELAAAIRAHWDRHRLLGDDGHELEAEAADAALECISTSGTAIAMVAEVIAGDTNVTANDTESAATYLAALSYEMRSGESGP